MTEHVVATTVEVKRPWKSKIIVLNAVMGIIAVYRLVSEGNANAFEAFINSNGALIDSIWAGLNVAWRFVTKDPIGLRD
jgi:hypothetical protein